MFGHGLVVRPALALAFAFILAFGGAASAFAFAGVLAFAGMFFGLRLRCASAGLGAFAASVLRHRGEGCAGDKLFSIDHAIISLMTFPFTSVSRYGRPWKS